MILPFELLRLADTIIDSLDQDSESHYLTEDSLLKLHNVFPDTILLAALDLIDQRKVTESTTPWGFIEYEVLGSNATHIVYITLPKALTTSYCTCPAFNFAVLETGQSLMCKHVLATRLAVRLDLCVKQQISLDYLATVASQRYK
ncbi:hypothetical protein BT96DRAFT_1570 [Gymnopus androsaceus JB14]|uniref:SWIM-type domain-containing protein n=1 Tax=Gymnopus androsaceus JB14 TaxID=1447944 RepID=A0A6A4IUD8_9AGAR|nr:hypothetical protein BT96DRAFT_1570 [Gymnopus androsaceus JB14]